MKIGKIGIDTSILIDFLLGNHEAIALVNEHINQLIINELVVYEFLCGNLTNEQELQFLQAVQSIPTISLTRQAILKAKEIYRNAKKRGEQIPHQDCLIAGAYISEGVQTILTKNTKHFSRCMHVITY